MPTASLVERRAPLTASLPPAPDVDPLTPAQWATLLAIADAFVPALEPTATTGVTATVATESAPSNTTLLVPAADYSSALSALEARDTPRDLAISFLSERASHIDGFKPLLARIFAFYLPVTARDKLTGVLNLLDTRAGALIFTGYATPFAAQPASIREAILKSWAAAKLPVFRGLFLSLAGLMKQVWLRTSPTVNEVLSIPRIPVHGVAGQSFPFEFIQLPSTPDDDKTEVIETDVVIIGSGCGGGVAAKNLAEAGHKVLVVEERYHWPATYMPFTEKDGNETLFMNNGSIMSDDNNALIIAGASWGGGGTVNWSASLQPQHYVREEWAAQGLSFFTSPAFQRSLDRVCERMGVSADHIEHNKTNRLLLEGGRKLGWTVKPVPQNTGGKKHYCGTCTLGCHACEKQGPVVSWLPDAARAGAKFIEGFRAQKIVFEKGRGEKLATGVEGIWTSRDEQGGVSGVRRQKKVFIKAKKVIVSCGSLQSPLLLRRSGLKNSHIGNNLKIHPVSFCGAIFDEEVRPWEGSILTAVVSDFQNQDGQGHGVKLEAMCMLPSVWLALCPWTSSLGYKTLVSQHKNMCAHIALARDRTLGSVYEDPIDGRVHVRYPVDPVDKKHITEGVIALAKMNYVEGARVIFGTDPGVAPFIRKADSNTSYTDDADFQAFLNNIRSRCLPAPDHLLGSAHQMGTNRMARAPHLGVVDPKGRVWETKNVYICDTSVFPSASGVNPMITVMGISDYISSELAEVMSAEAGVGNGAQQTSKL